MHAMKEYIDDNILNFFRLKHRIMTQFYFLFFFIILSNIYKRTSLHVSFMTKIETTIIIFIIKSYCLFYMFHSILEIITEVENKELILYSPELQTIRSRSDS